MSDTLRSTMSLLFSAAHSARHDRSVERALRVWRETGVVPIPRVVADAGHTSELPIALSVPSVQGSWPLS
jgi:hypothetical protein